MRSPLAHSTDKTLIAKCSFFPNLRVEDEPLAIFWRYAGDFNASARKDSTPWAGAAAARSGSRFGPRTT